MTFEELGITFFIVGVFGSKFAPVWTLPLVHADRAMNACERIAHRAIVLGNAAPRVRKIGVIRATRRLERAGDLLLTAMQPYHEATDDLNHALILLEMKPEESAGAPAALMAISRRIVAVGLLLDSVADRLNEIAREVLALAEQGVGPEPKAEPPSRPQPPPRQLVRRPPRPSERIKALFQRRQRWKTAAPEDAPREVSRGRAPPLLSDCAL